MSQNVKYFISTNVTLSGRPNPLLISYVDPGQYGVLTPYIGKKLSMEEVNELISMLLNHQLYLAAFPQLEVAIMWEDGHDFGQLHNLRFLNPEWQAQERGNSGIRFLK